jgi:hypothetical protein
VLTLINEDSNPNKPYYGNLEVKVYDVCAGRLLLASRVPAPMVHRV